MIILSVILFHQVGLISVFEGMVFLGMYPMGMPGFDEEEEKGGGGGGGGGGGNTGRYTTSGGVGWYLKCWK